MVPSSNRAGDLLKNLTQRLEDGCYGMFSDVYAAFLEVKHLSTDSCARYGAFVKILNGLQYGSESPMETLVEWFWFFFEACGQGTKERRFECMTDFFVFFKKTVFRNPENAAYVSSAVGPDGYGSWKQLYDYQGVSERFPCALFLNTFSDVNDSGEQWDFRWAICRAIMTTMVGTGEMTPFLMDIAICIMQLPAIGTQSPCSLKNIFLTNINPLCDQRSGT